VPGGTQTDFFCAFAAAMQARNAAVSSPVSLPFAPKSAMERNGSSFGGLRGTGTLSMSARSIR
jgi:hypothetical protein